MTDAVDARSDDAEFTPGLVLEGASRTITNAEIAFLPALMGAINPLFHDEETAKKGPMGSRILYGPALLEHFGGPDQAPVPRASDGSWWR